MGVSTCGLATSAWKKGERRVKKTENNLQDALETLIPPVSGSHNRKSCFHNTAMSASAVPSWSVTSLLSLKPQGGFQTEAGVTQIIGVLQCSAAAHVNFFYITQGILLLLLLFFKQHFLVLACHIRKSATDH